MSSQRFRRRQRILTGADFSRCFAGRRKLASRYFRLHWLDTGSASRLGMAVSRKVDKRAVVRNRIKRGIRESFRLGPFRLAGGDAVVVARREAASASAADLRRDLDQLWRRALALPASSPEGTMRAGPDAVTVDAGPSPAQPSPSPADANRSPDIASLPSA